MPLGLVQGLEGIYLLSNHWLRPPAHWAWLSAKGVDEKEWNKGPGLRELGIQREGEVLEASDPPWHHNMINS